MDDKQAQVTQDVTNALKKVAQVALRLMELNRMWPEVTTELRAALATQAEPVASVGWTTDWEIENLRTDFAKDLCVRSPKVTPAFPHPPAQPQQATAHFPIMLAICRAALSRNPTEFLVHQVTRLAEALSGDEKAFIDDLLFRATNPSMQTPAPRVVQSAQPQQSPVVDHESPNVRDKQAADLIPPDALFTCPQAGNSVTRVTTQPPCETSLCPYRECDHNKCTLPNCYDARGTI